MVRLQVFQFDMTDGGVNSACEFFITYYGGMLCPAFLFQINDIIAIWLELLAVVGGDAFLTFLFKGRSKRFGPFSCVFFCPCWRNAKGSRPRFQLSALSVPATVNTNRIGNQFAVFVAAFLNVSHCFHLLYTWLHIRAVYPAIISPDFGL